MNADKPLDVASLELLRRADPVPGEEYACGPGRYPEVFVRVRLRFEAVSDVYSDAPEDVRAASPLFWDEGVPVRILAAAHCADGAWSLSLTRWGVLRWEYVSAEGGPPVMAVESRLSVQSMVDCRREFWCGVVLQQHGRGVRARLVVGGGPAEGLSVEGSREFDEAVPLVPESLATREPAVRELFAANTCLFHLCDSPAVPAAVDADFPGGSALGARLRGNGEVVVRHGAGLAGTSDNYWHFFRVNDPSVRTVRFECLGEMSSTFFVSEDRRAWEMTPVTLDGRGRYGEHEGYIRLPARAGGLYVANAPVYGDVERDRDLERCRELGCQVDVLDGSTLGLPMHMVTLTDASAPLAGKRGVFLLCGQHSPVEQMGGHLGMPCIEELVRLNSTGDTAGLLRRLAFYWVPIFNVDCALQGTPGYDARLTNPNRCWFANHGPGQRAVEDFFLARREEGLEMVAMLDIHAGGAWRNHNILADYDVVFAGEPCTVDIGSTKLHGPDARKAALFERLDELAGLREVWHNGRVGAEKKRAPEWFQDAFAIPAFTIECSVVSQLDPATRLTEPFTLDAFRQLGTNLGRYFAEVAAGPVEAGAG